MTKRYLLTTAYEGGPSAHNYTIGGLLRVIRRYRVMELAEQHLPMRGDRPIHFQMAERERSATADLQRTTVILRHGARGQSGCRGGKDGRAQYYDTKCPV